MAMYAQNKIHLETIILIEVSDYVFLNSWLNKTVLKGSMHVPWTHIHILLTT